MGKNLRRCTSHIPVLPDNEFALERTKKETTVDEPTCRIQFVTILPALGTFVVYASACTSFCHQSYTKKNDLSRIGIISDPEKSTPGMSDPKNSIPLANPDAGSQVSANSSLGRTAAGRLPTVSKIRIAHVFCYCTMPG